jgi:glycosyltransferase involved in cell wall biosynthesis
VRVLIFHGYLLDGTGSNVYNARLADALVRLGHEVHLLCQDRHPHEHTFVDAAGDWDAGVLRVSQLHDGPVEAEAEAGAVAGAGAARGRCTVYRPNIGGLLPVYVADRYEGIEARAFPECSDDEIGRYIDANVAAVCELRGSVRPELALANHLVMGPVILARGLQGAVPYAVKVHGSALEYVVKPHPERFLGLAREGLQGARGVLVGSRHTAASLWRALDDDGSLARRTRLGPPGVDVQRFAPRQPEIAAAGVRALAAQLRRSAATSARATGHGEAQAIEHVEAQAIEHGQARTASAFARDEHETAVALEQLRPDHDALVAFVGKLIVSKGADLLIASWPLVLERVPRARLVLVGFGAYRRALARLRDALADADMDTAREVALAGRSLESPSAGVRPLRHLLAFLEGLRGSERGRYLHAARAMRERVVFTGRLEHAELAQLLPACQAVVVPSTFPEAFGMVAAEAAACAALPISAAHSGLAEVSQELACNVPEQARAWLSFPVDDGAVRALAACLLGWLTAPPELRAQTRSGLVGAVRERWSWDGVACGVIAAARGQLDDLREP